MSLNTRNWKAWQNLQPGTNGAPTLHVKGEVETSNGNQTPHLKEAVPQGKMDFLYGKVEVLAKLPRARGSWPAIWLMPIHPSPSYHGYDVLNYYNVNPEYGTMTDFKRLLDEVLIPICINDGLEDSAIDRIPDDLRGSAYVQDHPCGDDPPFDPAGRTIYDSMTLMSHGLYTEPRGAFLPSILY